jgi:hypothetical protein
MKMSDHNHLLDHQMIPQAVSPQGNYLFGSQIYRSIVRPIERDGGRAAKGLHQGILD